MKKLTKKQRNAMEFAEYAAIVDIERVETEREEAKEVAKLAQRSKYLVEVRVNSCRGIFRDQYGQNSFYVHE